MPVNFFDLLGMGNRAETARTNVRAAEMRARRAVNTATQTGTSGSAAGALAAARAQTDQRTAGAGMIAQAEQADRSAQGQAISSAIAAGAGLAMNAIPGGQAAAGPVKDITGAITGAALGGGGEGQGQEASPLRSLLNIPQTQADLGGQGSPFMSAGGLNIPQTQADLGGQGSPLMSAPGSQTQPGLSNLESAGRLETFARPGRALSPDMLGMEAGVPAQVPSSQLPQGAPQHAQIGRLGEFSDPAAAVQEGTMQPVAPQAAPMPGMGQVLASPGVQLPLPDPRAYQLDPNQPRTQLAAPPVMAQPAAAPPAAAPPAAAPRVMGEQDSPEPYLDNTRRYMGILDDLRGPW